MLFSLRFKSSFSFPIKKAHLRCTSFLVPKVGFAPLRFLASSFRSCPQHALFTPVQILFFFPIKKAHLRCTSFLVPKVGFAPLHYHASSFRACPQHALFTPVQILFFFPIKKAHLWCTSFLVPKVGFEPTRYRYHRILSPTRLPIPSLRHNNCNLDNIAYWNICVKITGKHIVNTKFVNFFIIVINMYFFKIYDS